MCVDAREGGQGNAADWGVEAALIALLQLALLLAPAAAAHRSRSHQSTNHYAPLPLLANPTHCVCRYDRAELRAAVSFYNRPGPLPEIQKRSWSSLGFFIPPPFAVAHHLISAWASRWDSRDCKVCVIRFVIFRSRLDTTSQNKTH